MTLPIVSEVDYKGKSIFAVWSTVSTCSFHATKIFHTGEGGAAICTSDMRTYINKLFYQT